MEGSAVLHKQFDVQPDPTPVQPDVERTGEEIDWSAERAVLLEAKLALQRLRETHNQYIAKTNTELHAQSKRRTPDATTIAESDQARAAEMQAWEDYAATSTKRNVVISKLDEALHQAHKSYHEAILNEQFIADKIDRPALSADQQGNVVELQPYLDKQALAPQLDQAQAASNFAHARLQYVLDQYQKALEGIL